MPVMIWIISIVSAALPNTYHQPIGPATDLGIRWVSIGQRLSRRQRGASNHAPIARRHGLLLHSSLLTECLARSDSEELESPAGPVPHARLNETTRGAAAPRRARRTRKKPPRAREH